MDIHECPHEDSIRRGSFAPIGYADAMEEALDRLRTTGFEFGGFFSCHAPMAAEALGELGYADAVPGWVDGNRRLRRYTERPGPRWTIDPDGWREQLGDFGRVGDWAAMFERELAEEPWCDVVARWWPRLLPGLVGALGHGVIRTAHAIRSVSSVADPTPLQLNELAQGLGYWASRYQEPRGASSGLLADVPADSGGDADKALRDLSVTAAGIYADRAPRPPIPLVHMITVPAAVHMVLPVLPPDQHEQSYVYARRASAWIAGVFPGMFRSGPVTGADGAPPLAQTITAAVELGDEHAIKLAEACRRLGAASPDDRLPRAAATLVRRLNGRIGGA